MKQLYILVSGFVQGVGFRAFTVKKAKKLGLTGFARNLIDGRVEIRVQGEEDKLRELLVHVKKGSYFSQVKNVLVKEEKITEKFVDMIKEKTI